MRAPGLCHDHEVESPLTHLGVAPASSRVRAQRRAGFVLRRPVLRHDIHLTWTVDDRPMSELVAPSPAEGAGALQALATAVQHDVLGSRLGVHQLQTLLDEIADPGWGTVTRDGRVVLAWCPRCFGTGCPVLSARLLMCGDSVWWREVGWQLAGVPYEATGDEPMFRFLRTGYETLLEGLLVREQIRARSRS